jgi:hypothetical protein
VAGRIVKDDIEALRRQADIVAVVSDYTTLKRAGRSYKGLCPFHTEKTPSFNVTPDGNFFHCFGCDASGDIYDFLMRIEGLEFPEAVEALARRSGFTLRYEELSARDRQAIGQRSRLVEVTAAALEFFRTTLFSAEGEVARNYLKERGFGRDDAQRFDLGYAPNQWEALAQSLTRSGLPAEDLIATGLVCGIETEDAVTAALVTIRTTAGDAGADRLRHDLLAAFTPVQDAGGAVTVTSEPLIIAEMNEDLGRFQVRAVLLTHAHDDHVSAAPSRCSPPWSACCRAGAR